MSQGADQEEAKETALNNLKLVEELQNGNTFFGGKTIGLLDFAYGWLAYFHDVMKKASSLNLLNEETFPNLCTWIEQFRNIPVIKENWPDEEAMILKIRERRQARGI